MLRKEWGQARERRGGNSYFHRGKNKKQKVREGERGEGGSACVRWRGEERRGEWELCVQYERSVAAFHVLVNRRVGEREQKSGWCSGKDVGGQK